MIGLDSYTEERQKWLKALCLPNNYQSTLAINGHHTMTKNDTDDCKQVTRLTIGEKTR